ncbi:hypothetical protein BDW22DRAFT_1303692, partial [Trametopsis cervina]
LGARSPNKPFSLVDYARYEDIRDALLRSCQGRAALMRGGIIWRLAVEVIGFDDVLFGPSGNHTRQDAVVMDGENFVDDELNQHQLDLICGVYRIVKPPSNDVSWWPKENTWQESGMYVGYWTDVAEQWFQKRRSLIKEGGAQPLPASKWKTALSNKKGKTK